MAEISNDIGVPSVSPTTTAPDDAQNVQDKAGPALAELGAGASKAGQFLGQVQTDGAVNNAMDQVNATLDNYKTLRGEDATNAKQDTQNQINQTFATARRSLNTPEQQLQFDQTTRSYQQRYIAGQISAHADEEAKTHATEVNQSSMSLALNRISTSAADDDVFNNSRLDARAAAVKQLQIEGNGSDPSMVQSAVARADQLSWKVRIDAIAPNDPAAALKMVEQNKAALGTDYAPLTDRYTPKARDASADILLNGIAPIGGIAATGLASSLIQSTATDLGIDPVQAQTVSYLESRGGTVPDRPGSIHTGPFQLSDAEFAAGGGTTRGAIPDEVKAGVSVLGHSQTAASAALGRPAVPWEQYLTFQQGAGGGAALLKADPSVNVVDALAPAYGGNRNQASVAIAQNGGNPAATVGQFRSLIANKYAAGEQAARGSLIAQHDYPDVAGLETKVLAATAGNPDLQQVALSKLHERLAVLDVQATAAKQQLAGTLDGTNAALLAGDTTVPIPEATIRAAMPAPEADRVVADLRDSQQAGLLLKGLRWAAPDQVATTMADLATPDGNLSKMMRRQGAPGTADDNALPPETPDQTLRRQKIAGMAQTALAARDTALSTDPAAYVQANPAVATAIQNWRAAPNDPGAVQNYYATSIAAQQRLGLQSWQTHVLTTQEAGRLAGSINNADPSKVDVGAMLDQQAKTYGQFWPQAFGDMVRLGKLDPRYQVLASMDAPRQALARGDYQRALQAQTARGAGKDPRADVPADAKKDIDSGLDDALSDFRQTAAIPGLSANTDLMGNVQNSVRTLADYYAVQGMDGQAALKRATDGVLGEKYDFDGTVRAPKGTIAQVEQATGAAISSLKPTDIVTASHDPIIGPMRQADLFRAVQRAKWVPNEADDGLVAVAPLNNGAMWPVRMANGQRLELKFSNLGKPNPITIGGAAPAAPPASPGGSVGGLPYAPLDTGSP